MQSYIKKGLVLNTRLEFRIAKCFKTRQVTGKVDGSYRMGLNENEVTRPIVRYYMAFKLDFSDNWKNYPSRYQLFRCLLFFSYRHENQYTKTMEALSILWLLSFCQSILISKWLYDADLNPLRDALVQHLKGFWQPRQCNNLST